MINEHSLSIVVPVYNEAGIIEKMVRDYHREIAAKFRKAEFIVVNDQSTDATPDILEKLRRELGILVITLPRNSGHGPALRAGLEKASGDLVFHTDSDYQHDPKDFWLLYETIPKADVALGFRNKRQDNVFRLFLTKLVVFSNFLLFGVYLRDANIPFKIYKKGVLARTLPKIDPEALAPSIFINLLAKRLGFVIAEVPVAHFSRKVGQPSLLKWKLFRFCRQAFKELLIFRKTRF
ncbi:MAG: glycosyltransferase family 2 protein [Candidatus Margulisbacteria bacterium]|nr:glycosyltransferase family 2 protein [Candidatus Margulisiibacteriota bacterium]